MLFLTLVSFAPLATAMTPMDDLGTYNDVHDELVIVDLETKDTRRCALDFGLGAAHVVTDGALAWISAYGHSLYALDAGTGDLVADVPVDYGPHGVVVSADGGTVWATTLAFGTVARVDVATGTMTGSTAVGSGPNGISLSEAVGVAP